MKRRLLISIMTVALLCLGGWTVQANGQRSGAVRQAWEYKTLVLIIAPSGTTLYEDGRLLPGSATPITKAPVLGADGWELVSVAATVDRPPSGSSTTSYVYWFKRPK